MTEYLISPKVHRALYQYSIKRFLEDQIDDIQVKIDEYGINMSEDLSYSHLLDRLISEVG